MRGRRVVEGFVRIQVFSATIYFLAVCFGAPVFSDIPATFLLAELIAVLTCPATFLYWADQTHFVDILVGRCDNFADHLCQHVIYGVTGGAWLGSFVIPLDWDVWWQRYPLPNLAGAVAGFCLSLIEVTLYYYCIVNRRTKEKVDDEEKGEAVHLLRRESVEKKDFIELGRKTEKDLLNTQQPAATNINKSHREKKSKSKKQQ